MAKQYYKGQEVLGYTEKFGKPYFWMRDGDGTTYLIKAKEQKAVSVGPDGAEVFTQELVPDFYGLSDVS